MKTVYRLFLVTMMLAILVMACAINASAPMPGSVGEPASETPMAYVGPDSPLMTRPLTPVDQLGRTGSAIKVDIETYRLVVEGLVEQPLSLTYEELLAYPAVSQLLTLECPGFFVDYAEWTGPLVRTLLEEAGIKPEAKEILFSEGDDTPYQKTLTLDEALADDTLLAYKVNGVTLPVEHGYPVRLAAGSKLGSYWVKWLSRIEVK